MENTNTTVESAHRNPLADFAKRLVEESGQTIHAPKNIREYAVSKGVTNDDLYKFVIVKSFQISRGQYDLSGPASGVNPKSNNTKLRAERKSTNTTEPGLGLQAPVTPPVKVSASAPEALKLRIHDTTEESTYIPEVDKTYVRWGSFNDVLKIVESEQFFPVYIAGPSGNGKTFMVEQAVAKSGRKFIRVQLTPETDEDDLLGGFRLIDGNTVFCKGPVIRAMEEGSVILLDEIDRATNKIMCLQSVLEGKSVLLKKTGETVFPKPGFQVIATANTRGRGCDDGKYTAASIIDDAFLERFPITMNQSWPTKAIERKIIMKHMEKFDCVDEDFADKLVTWSQIIHKTYERDGVDEEVSTRRLCHTIQTYGIFRDRMDAIRLVVNRFDPEIGEAFIDLYTKVDSGALQDEDVEQPNEILESKIDVNGFTY